MGKETGIAWTDHTYNLVRGCTRISPGCRFCYAESASNRNPGVLGIWGPNGTRVLAAKATMDEPIKWDRAAESANERKRVFTASIGDIFEEWEGPISDSHGKPFWVMPNGEWTTEGTADSASRALHYDDCRDRLHALISLTPWLDWLLLTKRPEVALSYYHRPGLYRRIMIQADSYWREHYPHLRGRPVSHPWKQLNRWNGVSVENQEAANERIPILKKIPAKVRFLSMEPLLEPVNITPYAPYLDWVIVGGESHKQRDKARPFYFDWARHIVHDCHMAGTKVFVKQGGSNAHPCCSHPKGEDMVEWPEYAQVQEFPDAPGDILLRKDLFHGQV